MNKIKIGISSDLYDEWIELMNNSLQLPQNYKRNVIINNIEYVGCWISEKLNEVGGITIVMLSFDKKSIPETIRLNHVKDTGFF
jgi:sorbitol-specific phosphotransferase system component IIA